MVRETTLQQQQTFTDTEMILDVLIIGSGPHALTLSTLLSSPGSSPHTGHAAPQAPLSLEASRLSKTKSRGRRKIRTATAGVVDPPCPEAPGPPDISPCPRMRFLVVDSYGRWAGLWEGQFVALNIPHLRSHTLVHTDPFHKKALQDFVVKSGRSSELHSLPDQVYILDENAYFNDMRLGKKEQRRLHVSSSLKRNPSFSLPGTRLSVDFFRNQVKVQPKECDM